MQNQRFVEIIEQDSDSFPTFIIRPANGSYPRPRQHQKPHQISSTYNLADFFEVEVFIHSQDNDYCVYARDRDTKKIICAWYACPEEANFMLYNQMRSLAARLSRTITNRNSKPAFRYWKMPSKIAV